MTPSENYMQSDITKLMPSLIKAKAKIGSILKYDATNPFLKNEYVSLEGLLKKVNGPLLENGLMILQMPTGDKLITKLAHESGQFIQFEYILNPVKQDPQSIGSNITYAKRYSIESILSLSGGKEADMDDDGTEASKNANTGGSEDSDGQSNSLSSIKSKVQEQKTKAALDQFFKTLPEKAQKNRAVIDLFKSRKIELIPE